MARAEKTNPNTPSSLQLDGRRRSVKKRRKKKNKLRRFILLFVFLVILLAAASIYLVNAVFLVREVKASGSVRYTGQQVVDAAGIEPGEKLMLVDKAAVSDRLKKALPYIGQAYVSLKIPATVEIAIVDTSVDTGIYLSGAVYYLDEDFKILEKVALEESAGIPLFTGAQAEGETEVGEVFVYAEEAAREAHDAVLEAIDDCSMQAEIYFCDISDRFAVRLQYEDRFVIELGNCLDLADKLTFAKNIVSRLGEDRRGYVYAQNTKKGSFLPVEGDNENFLIVDRRQAVAEPAADGDDAGADPQANGADGGAAAAAQ